MQDWKMIDADGHIREIESDVYEYLPDYYKARREAVMYFPAAAAPRLASSSWPGRNRRVVFDSDVAGLAAGVGHRQA